MIAFRCQRKISRIGNNRDKKKQEKRDRDVTPIFGVVSRTLRSSPEAPERTRFGERAPRGRLYNERERILDRPTSLP
jgi:hypothetical protein